MRLIRRCRPVGLRVVSFELQCVSLTTERQIFLYSYSGSMGRVEVYAVLPPVVHVNSRFVIFAHLAAP